ncbi:MAG: hypothetical protein HF308_20090 [Ignavibacteria bacterium]|jgi:hypothetical protein|nr:hypothetical protein [Ignavibacteria bacterium]
MTKNYVQTLVYKQHETDTFAAVLKNNGVGVDLTQYTIRRFHMNDGGEHAYTLTCTLNCTYQGNSVSGAQGGITVTVDRTSSSVTGDFDGEFEIGVTENNVEKTDRFPSGENYYKIRIIESVQGAT